MNSNTICQDTLKKMTFQFQWLQKMDPEALNRQFLTCLINGLLENHQGKGCLLHRHLKKKTLVTQVTCMHVFQCIFLKKPLILMTMMSVSHVITKICLIL